MVGNIGINTGVLKSTPICNEINIILPVLIWFLKVHEYHEPEILIEMEFRSCAAKSIKSSNYLFAKRGASVVSFIWLYLLLQNIVIIIIVNFITKKL